MAAPIPALAPVTTATRPAQRSIVEITSLPRSQLILKRDKFMKVYESLFSHLGKEHSVSATGLKV
jgi:hypothetical protein